MSADVVQFLASEPATMLPVLRLGGCPKDTLADVERFLGTASEFLLKDAFYEIEGRGILV